MGIATSSQTHLFSGAQGSSHHPQGDVIRQCHCYTQNSSHTTCQRHSTSFSSGLNETHHQYKQGRSKKRRSHGFATFKKKLIDRCKTVRGPDHSKLFREYALESSSEALGALLSQYEALSTIKDLSVQADLARPPARTLGQCLGELFDSGRCADLILTYGIHRFHLHKTIVMARCPYFNQRIPIISGIQEFPLPKKSCLRLEPETLGLLLKYLYTGEPPPRNLLPDGLGPALEASEFVVPNSLESDVSFIHDSMSLSDAILVFNSSNTPREEGGFTLSLPCHQSLLSARSTFFKNLIKRKASYSSPLKIVLDENVIPSKYAKALLGAIYMDTVNLTLISQSESDHLIAAMDLYEIGRFLEFDFLSQSCEDILMGLLSPDNIVQILEWSLQPHGSPWIRRQAFQFAHEGFVQISNSESFEKLNYQILKELTASDYTQASECEILHAIIRWGELQLFNKAEKEIQNQTLSRRSNSRRRDICDNELRILISPLIADVRVSHFLPKDRHSDVLDNALHRNLIARPSSFLAQTEESKRFSSWDPRNLDGLYVKPRLFLPYYEETKNILKDKYGHDLSYSSASLSGLNIPDTLYMVKQDDNTDMLEYESSVIPDKERIDKMSIRVSKLLQTVAVQRAMSFPLVRKSDVIHLVELRVIRECNLPDSYTSILRENELNEDLDEDFSVVRDCNNRRIFERYDLSMGRGSKKSASPDVVSLPLGAQSMMNLEHGSSSPDLVDGVKNILGSTTSSKPTIRPSTSKLFSTIHRKKFRSSQIYL